MIKTVWPRIKAIWVNFKTEAQWFGFGLLALGILGVLWQFTGSQSRVLITSTNTKYPAGRSIELYSAEKQALIKTIYAELLSAYEKRDYKLMEGRANAILAYVDDFNDTKSYQTIAKRGIEEIAIQENRRILQERESKIKAEVTLLVEKTSPVYERCYTQNRCDEQLDTFFNQIFKLDPSNKIAVTWKANLEKKRLVVKAAEDHKRAVQMMATLKSLKGPKDDPIVLEVKRSTLHLVLKLDPNIREAVVQLAETEEKIASVERKNRLRNIASMEIKGAGLVKKAKADVNSRADLYDLMDQLLKQDPKNPFPEQWMSVLRRE